MFGILGFALVKLKDHLRLLGPLLALVHRASPNLDGTLHLSGLLSERLNHLATSRAPMNVVSRKIYGELR